MVPHLTTSLTGPLAELEQTLLRGQPEIEAYLRQQWQTHRVPFYTSVDLRMSGFKLAPVDTNLFPGGFNNLNLAFNTLSVHALMSAVDKLCPASEVLLIPENHTRNTYYLQNVYTLVSLMRQAGMRVRVGTMNPEITAPTDLITAGGDSLHVEPLKRYGDLLSVDEHYKPCAVVLNNDLSAGVPDILCGIKQSMVPPLNAGWTTRSKEKHFTAYDGVADEVAALLKIDPWLINPYHAYCGEVDFKAQTGLDCLASNVEQILARVQSKYTEYGIKETPFLIVKADAGTYGMGVMTVKSVDDVVGLNRDARKKMAVVKEGLEVHQVIIQEGVYTQERIEQDGVEKTAEPVIYMVDKFVVGGFYRVHGGRGVDQNLNAPGASFVPLAFEKPCTPEIGKDCPPNRFYSYGVIARLAQLAASRELEAMPQIS
jgi:glutamate--cysteine ligase